MKRLRVSVRSLVEHSLRSGDLSSSWEPANPLDGARLHRLIQKSRNGDYASEITVSETVERAGFRLQVLGRLDGVFTFPDRVVIEEIKTTGRDLDQIDGWGNPLHWGQAKVYALIYARRHEPPAVEVQLTYCHRRSGQTREFARGFQQEELGRFFDQVVDRYLEWMRALDEHRGRRDASLEGAGFPYPHYRPGQRPLAVAVYRSLAAGGRLLAQAPTGIGKTMAVIFPALKAVSKGFAQRLLYVTPRTTGKGVAEAALDALARRGLAAKAVTLTAREKICFNPEKACDPEECEFAKGYYDRIGEARRRLFESHDFSRCTIESLARQHTVCPFALSLELARWADVVICDYHYAFSPSAPAGPLGLEEEPCFVAVDEAHNLVDRAREMYSAQVRLGRFQALRRAFKGRPGPLGRRIGGVVLRLGEIRGSCLGRGGSTTERTAPKGLTTSLLRFAEQAEAWLAEAPEPILRGPLLEAYFDALRFLRVADEYGVRHATCCEASERDFSVTLFCLDPSPRLAEALARFAGAALFSATLTPLQSFQRTLGCGDAASRLALPSPFPSGNLYVALSDQISTLYRRRQDTCLEVARLLATFVNAKAGHYLLFFPSYRYLEMVRAAFCELAEGVASVAQRPDMAEEERDEFLRQFQSPSGGTLAGFAVLGGVFSEGIDLVGDRLAGAAIVGVGLPGPSPQRESVRQYLSEEENEGFDVAYRFPGMQRVLQAAGRVIRSEKDRGAVLLVDPRFSWSSYRRLLPAEWRPVPVRDNAGLARALDRFWSETLPEAP